VIAKVTYTLTTWWGS